MARSKKKQNKRSPRSAQMKDLEITGELKDDIFNNQKQLKNAICTHQGLLYKLQQDPDNTDLQKEIEKAEQDIVQIGISQKKLLQTLRDEKDTHQKSLKKNIIKNGIEEKRCNLVNALNRARKQNIVSRSTSHSLSSLSDDSIEAHSIHSSPEQVARPLEPHDIPQSEFLGYFALATHDVYKEMLNKRAERKRRSTANPQFLYGNKGWDLAPKRRRNNYLFSVSPPNTRQALRKKNMTNERVSPPLPAITNGNSSITGNNSNNNNVNNSTNTTSNVAVKPFSSHFPAIPNLPSGLTIERVSPSSCSSSPDSKACVTCRQPGSLLMCESCTNGFHVSCHNRPLAQSPRQCPRCLVKEVRTVGSLNVPSGMSVSYLNPAELAEKLEQKKQLETMNKSLSAELTQLQDRHSQLTISLKNQKNQQEELLNTQQTTEERVKQIVKFIKNFKNMSDNSSNDSVADEQQQQSTLESS